MHERTVRRLAEVPAFRMQYERLEDAIALLAGLVLMRLVAHIRSPMKMSGTAALLLLISAAAYGQVASATLAGTVRGPVFRGGRRCRRHGGAEDRPASRAAP